VKRYFSFIKANEKNPVCTGFERRHYILILPNLYYKPMTKTKNLFSFQGGEMRSVLRKPIAPHAMSEK
jgi:hypothetical protein